VASQDEASASLNNASASLDGAQNGLAASLDESSGSLGETSASLGEASARLNGASASLDEAAAGAGVDMDADVTDSFHTVAVMHLRMAVTDLHPATVATSHHILAMRPVLAGRARAQAARRRPGEVLGA
jgi:hypothetical protein